MAQMLDLGDVLELVNDRFNDGAFASLFLQTAGESLLLPDRFKASAAVID
ncbi:hypothetical protein H6F86_17600 [Phormidium sp. FACHB-592]|uniref:Uncharacterized protein n=1 Tax=Stenomitos frigidus AS-A4 TaxID=2933935 RepID=A0ABV0KIA3_9CYAN|nr:hypothetical protein [Phormidium sp. FACHB-592]MBD2075673.1 hypothetical protein [Phormidium sp. FACHB-592]